MTFSTWLLLGLCSGYVPNDKELTLRLCEAQYAAEHRDIKVNSPMDEFDRVYFEWEMKRKL